jgi:hypothetical protein
MEYILNIDSNNRDTGLYPYGNSYVLNLVTPIKNVSRVELIAAKVPNSIYNLTSDTSTTLLRYQELINTYNVRLPKGFYTAYTLAADINSSNNVPNLTVSYLPSEGKYLFNGLQTFTLTAATNEMAVNMGLPYNVPITSTLNTTANNWYQYSSNLALSGSYFVKSSNVIDLSVNEFLYLDIEELRTVQTHDARKIVQMNTTGATLNTTEMSTVENTFGIITMDVDSGGYKIFKESADYKIKADFPQRIPKISKLTIKWKNSKGETINFNGLENNSLMLRFICDPQPVTIERAALLPPPVPMAKSFDKRLLVIGAFLITSLIVIIFMRKK